MGSLNSIIQGDAFKLSFAFLIIGSLAMMLMSKLRKLFTKDKKKAILFALFMLLTFALVGLLSSSKVLNNTPINSFLGFQVLFLILGIIHVAILNKYFKDLTEDDNSFFPELLLSLVAMCIGLIAFFNVVNIFRAPFKFIYLASVIAFIMPFLTYKLYQFATLIPVPFYKKWFYPVGENIKDPTSKELSNPLVISFEFKKQHEIDDVTNFRVKAPEAMEFGKLFYFFINDYNERHPESQIEFLNNKELNPEGWIFYLKPNWWRSLKHIDFSKTVASNNIREDHVIVCQRVQKS